MGKAEVIELYKDALTREYGYFTVGYHTYTAGQILEKMLGDDDFARKALSYVCAEVKAGNLPVPGAHLAD